MIQPQQLAATILGRSSQKPIPKLTPANTDEHRITPGFNISPCSLPPLRAPTRRFIRGGGTGDKRAAPEPIQPNPTSKIHQNFAPWRLLRLCAKSGTPIP